VLAGKFNRYGYVRYCIALNGKSKNITAHQAVAVAFLGPAARGQVVNHKNGVKSDNRLENLEWQTPSGNHLHALASGLFEPPSGEDHWHAALTANDIRALRGDKGAGALNRELAAKYGISMATVSRYVNRVGRADAH
jgi:hypothetical protein